MGECPLTSPFISEVKFKDLPTADDVVDQLRIVAQDHSWVTLDVASPEQALEEELLKRSAECTSLI